MLISTEHDKSTAELITTKMLKLKNFLDLRRSEVALIMLINIKKSTIFGILTFMSKINFMLSGAEHKINFTISGSGLIRQAFFCFCSYYGFCFKNLTVAGEQQKCRQACTCADPEGGQGV